MSERSVQVEFQYFRALLICFTISIALLAGTHIIGSAEDGARLLPMVVAAVPIAIYHLLVLRPRAKAGLSQAAIDSVYYFGFLVTVAALGVSAVTIARSGDVVDVDAVVYQFGIGLFATGYAVLARLHLTSIAKESGAANPETALDAYVTRSQGLIDNLDLAMSSFRALSESAATVVSEIRQLNDSVLNNIRAVSEAALVSNVDAIRAASRAIVEEIETRGTESIAVLQDARALFQDAAFKDDREAFCRSVREFTKDASDFRAALQASVRPVQDLAVGLGSASQGMAHVGQVSTQTAVALLEAWGAEGVSAKAAERLASVTGGLSDSAAEVLIANEALKALSAQAAVGMASHVKTSRTIARIDKLLTTLDERVVRLTEVFNSVGGASQSADQHIQSLEQAIGRLAERAPSLEKVQAAIGHLCESVERTTEGFEKSFSQSIVGLEAGVQRTATAGAALSENIVKIAEIVIERTSTRQATR